MFYLEYIRLNGLPVNKQTFHFQLFEIFKGYFILLKMEIYNLMNVILFHIMMAMGYKTMWPYALIYNGY